MAEGIGCRVLDSVGLIDFPHDVTAETREAAYNAYHDLARTRVQVVGLNFTHCDYMNSAGIGLVISLVEDALQAGRRVYAYGLTPHYRKLFDMVGLAERLVVLDTEAEVLERSRP